MEALHVNKRFGRYKKEGERELRAPAVTDDCCPTLIRAWRMLCVMDYYSEPSGLGGPEYDADGFLAVMARCSLVKYEEILDGRPYGFRATGNDAFTPELSVRSLQYGPEDVTRLSALLGNLLEEDEMCPQRTGLFLSALANLHPAPSYSIITTPGHPIPRFLGFRNMKMLSISGEAGAYLGASMADGEISVDGHARPFVGAGMEGGLIHIKGDSAGVPHNKGGLVIIEGDIGGYPGSYDCEPSGSSEERLERGIGEGRIILKGNVRSG